jgi:Mrp family chromosome partitioning ATPase/capsular polysaccharide biosynthesis protein
MARAEPRGSLRRIDDKNDIVGPEIQQPESVDVRELLRPIWRWRWIIIFVVAAVTAGTYYYYASKPSEYTTSTEILIKQNETDPGFESGNPDRVAQNLLRLFESSGIAAQARRRTGVSGHVDAEQSEGVDFIQVTVVAGSAEGAARLANAYADILIADRRATIRREAESQLRAARQELLALSPTDEAARTELQGRIDSLTAAQRDSTVGAEQVDAALPPDSPSAPRPRRNAAFAFFVSLLLAVAAAYGLDRLDRRIKRSEEAEKAYGFPLLTSVPHAPSASKDDGADLVPEPAFREAFRTLHTNLLFASLDRAPKTILVTSALPSEGKSTVVRNLALAYRDAGLRVAVVDSDLRHPNLATLFQVHPVPGLTNVLSGRTALSEALQQIGGDNPSVATAVVEEGASGNGASSPVRPGSISVLTSGPPPVNPPAVLATDRFQSIFDQIAAEYDVTLIDSAPLLAVSDSVPLFSRVDGTILVCRLGRATYDSVRQATTLLHRHAADVLGVVVNDVPAKGLENRYAGYYGAAT